MSRIILIAVTAFAASNDPWSAVRDIVSSQDAIWASNLSQGDVLGFSRFISARA